MKNSKCLAKYIGEFFPEIGNPEIIAVHCQLPVNFLANKPHLFVVTHVYFIKLNYPHMYAHCFGLYLGHLHKVPTGKCDKNPRDVFLHSLFLYHAERTV
jgi:hypothetical protein